MLSLLIGAILGLVGIDRLSGEARLTFGMPYLLDGLDPTIVAIGLFAVGETLSLAHCPAGDEHGPAAGAHALDDAAGLGTVVASRGCAARRSAFRWARCRPAAPSCRRCSPTPSRSGCRVTPTTSGTARSKAWPDRKPPTTPRPPGTLVPLLTLGLPASATAAVLLAGFQQFGLQAGPLLFQNEPRFVWTLLASLYVGNVLLLVLNLPLIRVWVLLLADPDAAALRRHPGGGHRSAPGPCIARPAISVALAAIGALGFALRRAGCPLAPVMIGVMLGPAADMHLRRALAIAEGDWTVLLTRPLSAALLATAVLVIVGPALTRRSRPS